MGEHVCLFNCYLVAIYAEKELCSYCLVSISNFIQPGLKFLDIPSKDHFCIQVVQSFSASICEVI